MRVYSSTHLRLMTTSSFLEFYSRNTSSKLPGITDSSSGNFLDIIELSRLMHINVKVI